MMPALARWVDRAACGTDPGFLDRTVAQQQRVCSTCPVTAQCLALGLSEKITAPSRHRFRHHDTGIYGGMTVAEVAQLREGAEACQP